MSVSVVNPVAKRPLEPSKESAHLEPRSGEWWTNTNSKQPPNLQPKASIEINGKPYVIQDTKPDGACALHALLGEEVDGEYAYGGPGEARDQLIEKIEREKSRSVVRKLLAEIIIGHLSAQNDPSSDMLFRTEAGARVKHGFHQIWESFAKEINHLGDIEAQLWVREIKKIQALLIVEAKKRAEFSRMPNSAILETLGEDRVQLLNFIYEIRNDFLALLEQEKRIEIERVIDEQVTTSEAFDGALKKFALATAFEQYIKTIRDPDFYFNTQEIMLAAILFEKKAQVLSSLGEAATPIINQELQQDTTYIYHQGCHFSRCTPRLGEPPGHATTTLRLLTWPIRATGNGIAYALDSLGHINASLFGSYTYEKDFSSRYSWTQHHVEALYKSTKQPDFWIQWSREGQNLYHKIHVEIVALRALKKKAQKAFESAHQKARYLPESIGKALIKWNFSQDYQLIYDTELSFLGSLDKIKLCITVTEKNAFVEKAQEDVQAIRDTIEALVEAPTESSWPHWIIEHRGTCEEIEERMDRLSSLCFLYVDDGLEGLRKTDGLSTADLRQFFNSALVEISRKHYMEYIRKEYEPRYENVRRSLEPLQRDYNAYHSTWANRVWSHWESEHEDDARLLRQKLNVLSDLSLRFTLAMSGNQDQELSPYADVQAPYRALFPSGGRGGRLQGLFKGFRSLLSGSRENLFPIPPDWKTHRHIGAHLGTSSPALALQLMFSEPLLGQLILEAGDQNGPLKAFYKNYLSADWGCHADALQTFISPRDQGVPNDAATAMDQYGQLLETSHQKLPVSPELLQSFRANERSTPIENLERILTSLGQGETPLSHTLVAQNSEGEETSRTHQATLDLPAPAQDTLERLVEQHFNLSSSEYTETQTFFLKPPKVLVLALDRSQVGKDALIGVMENFYLPSHFTISGKRGVHYTLVSFLVGTSHYRKTDFGYFRITDRKLEKVSKAEFLFAALRSSSSIYRRSEKRLSDQNIIEKMKKNDDLFVSASYTARTNQAVHGYISYNIPKSRSETFQNLVAFIQCIASTPLPLKKNICEKNPNDPLEQAFNKLPKELQQFLWKLWKQSNHALCESETPFLRDIQDDLLSMAKKAPLSVTPPENQQMYDQDGYVLTLMLDRLVKSFQQNTEKILQSDSEMALYLEAQHAVSRVIRSKRSYTIIMSAIFEETIHAGITYALPQKNRESAMRRQAIMSSSRVFTVIVDPLQERPLFQKTMHFGTSLILLGESLDQPNLSERDKNAIVALYLSRTVVSILPGSGQFQHAKDLSVAAISSYVLENPSPLVGWGVSASLQGVKELMIDDLPPDAPQSSRNFYAARILNPLSTNAALHGCITESITSSLLTTFKPLPRPKCSESLASEDQAKYPKQILKENPIIRGKIDNKTIELETANKVLEDKKDGVKAATAKKMEKFYAYGEKFDDIKCSSEKLEKAEKSHKRAVAHEKNCIAERDIAEAAVTQLEGEIKILEGQLYSPHAESTLAQIPNTQQQVTSLSEMHDGALYLRLVKEQGEHVKALAQAQKDLIDPNYSEFGSPQDTLIQKEAGVDNANKKKKDKWDDYQEALKTFRGKFIDGASREWYKFIAAKENYDNAVSERDVVKAVVDPLMQKITALNTKIAANHEAQLEAGAPKHIVAPSGELHCPVARKSSKYHHLAYFDTEGEKHSLGKYDNQEDARFVSAIFSIFEVTRNCLENQCFQGQDQLARQGIEIDAIPSRPKLETPTLSGTDATKNYQQIQAVTRRNQQAVTTYLERLGTLTAQPIQTQGLSQAEVNYLAQSMVPKIKDQKQHSLGYHAVRAPGKFLDKTSEFLGKIGFSGEVSTPKLPLYSSPASNVSDHPISQAYGPEPAPISTYQSQPALFNPDAPPQLESPLTPGLVHTLPQFEHPSAPIQQPPPIDYSQLWGKGTSPNLQLPPTDFSQLGRNPTIEPATLPPYEPSPALGLLPTLVVKVVNHFKTHDSQPVPSPDQQQFAQPLSLRAYPITSFEALPIPERRLGRELLENIHQVVHQYAQEIQTNYLQSEIDRYAGIAKGLGSMGAELTKVIIVVGTPFASRHQLEILFEQLDSSTSTLELHLNRSFQHINPSYNPDSASSKVGRFTGEYVIPSLLPVSAAPGAPRTIIYIQPDKLPPKLRPLLHALENPHLATPQGFTVPAPGRSLQAHELTPLHRSGKPKIPKIIPSAKLEKSRIKRLLNAGDRLDKKPYTRAGRNLTKKSYRENSIYQRPVGSPEQVNMQGRKVLQEILSHPNKTVTKQNHPRFGEILEVSVPDKGGAWFSENNEFICFIEP